MPGGRRVAAGIKSEGKGGIREHGGSSLNCQLGEELG